MYTVQYNFWTFFRFKNWLCKCIKIYFWLHTAHVHCALIVQSMLQMSSISQQSTFKTIAVITVALTSIFPQSHFKTIAVITVALASLFQQSHFKTISVITVALTSIFSQSHFKNIAVITVALTPHKVISKLSLYPRDTMALTFLSPQGL